MHKNRFFLGVSLFFVLLLSLSYVWAQGTLRSFLPVIHKPSSTPIPPPSPSPTPFAAGYRITYRLDRTVVPDVSFTDLTLKAYVGSISDAQLFTSSGNHIPHQYDPTTGIITFTTDADQVELTVQGSTNPAAIGPVTKAALKDDKTWAWSHGLDDNTNLQPSIAKFEEKGWRGTLYLIGYILEETRDEDWVVDEPGLRRLLNKGWSSGNHTWGHECHGGFDYRETIFAGYHRLLEVVATSARPDYLITSFAAPCFDGAYHPHILQMRSSGETAVLFNESGGRYKQLVDMGVAQDYTDGVRTAVAFHQSLPIGRDTRIEWDLPATLADIDWVATHSNANRHIWYNSMNHGGNEQALGQVVDHIYNRYGPAGDNSVWVAPSDHIYSYLLVRDHTIITWDSVPLPTATPMAPTATPSATATPSPTPTTTASPTTTATASPTASPPPTTSPDSTPAATNPQIEIANIAGVSGYEIGIFGSGFGETQGDGLVSILGGQAPILEWRDTFIRAVIPTVADGTGELIVTGHYGNNDSNPFTVYTIDPAFLTPPDSSFSNVLAGKTAHLQNLETYFCFAQPENRDTPPTQFLTDFRCGFGGITDTGSATFTADSSLGQAAIIAVDAAEHGGEALSGDYYFQFFTDSNWYPEREGGFRSVPANYELQISADSTNGIDGSWQTVHTTTGNNRAFRTHKITIPSSDYRWLRMQVVDGLYNQSDAAGKDFEIKEIRLYKPLGASHLRPDSLAIYGDSLTQAAFQAIGPSGLADAVDALRPTETNLIFTSFGLSGQSSLGLIGTAENEADIYDALTLDDMQTHALYWGIGLGTNDTFGGSSNLGVPHSNVEQFDDRLEAVIQHLLANGRIPILARMPDTIESLGGFGDLPTKKKIVEDIDTFAARYRLIPGPDLYTPFRYNHMFEEATYFGNDGIHHTGAGTSKLIELWAKAFVRP